MLAAGSVNHVTACTTKYAAGIAIMSGKTLTISGSGSLTATGKGRESSSYATKCTSAQWTALAAKGCAFLPAAGYREGLTVYNAGASGYYWSSSAHTSEVNQAYYVYFNSGALNSQYNGSRKKGQSVRLVCAAE